MIATLHYYHDLLSFGFEMPAVSSFSSSEGEPAYGTPGEIQQLVKQLVLSQGQVLSQRLLTGMMFTFPLDCVPDASGILMTMFELMPQETGTWVESTLQMVPAGSIKAGEAERLLKGISDKVRTGEIGRIRAILQGRYCFFGRLMMMILLTDTIDFTNSYRRRNVAPREGLGRLEATRFRFSG